ncbi:MAG TPA: ABC transporter ATP-binding protein [Deltaproteobacteria bacterium]|nr:ABC transporter ATP-binding protein [Deltaproteobacteria bacterium]HPR56450.1 ABC transporter ATP-binding protein [Deltaproteobacteria bacterium]HXK48431.1 ABC transporter ATP-binding protein [Deltaproteobacteria bacterium]
MHTSSEEFIRVEGVSMSFGRTTALSNVSLSVPRGKIFGLVGSDGAGKSTLLRLMATMIKPTTGSITIGGFDAAVQRWKVKPLIGYMPQRFGLYQDLTVEENMDFFMDIFGIRGKERVRRKEKYLGFSNLLPFLDRAAGDLSGGMKQKLGLACVLVHEPQGLILDEPTNGVDPVSRMEFWEILMQMKDQGMTIMVSTAYLDEGEKCDRVALMHKARVLTVQGPDELRGSHATLEEAMIARLAGEDRELAHDTFKR